MNDDYKPVVPGMPGAQSVYTRNPMVANAQRRVSEMQERSRLRRVLGDPALSARRPLYVIALLLGLAAIFLHYSLLLIAGLLVLAIAVVPEIWYVYGMRGLLFDRAPVARRVAFGSVVEMPLELENRSALPLPFVELEDNLPDDVAVLGMSLEISPLTTRAELTQTMGLWAYQRLRRRFYLRATQRGAYTFGPTTIRVTDPFGVVTREETLASERTLIVHPLIAPLEQLGLSPRALFGDHASRVRLLEDPLRVSGVRQYMPGDDPRRIHWKATARIGAPQSKLLDPSTQRTAMIALDIRTFKTVQMGYDPALSELAITAAATVAHWGFDNGYAVGLISNGALLTIVSDGGLANGVGEETTPGATPRLRLDPSSRPEWQSLILDGLARLLPYNGDSLASALSAERRTLPTGASVVYIGLDALVDVPTLIALRDIQTRGRHVALLLTSREDEAENRARDGAPEAHYLNTSGLDTHYIGGRARWRALEGSALGALGARRASAPIPSDQLPVERALIKEQRRSRQLRTEALRTGATENEAHADPTGSDTAPEGAIESAVN